MLPSNNGSWRRRRLTLMAFAADPGLKAALHEWSPETRALFIVPQFLRGALVFGGAGGSGLLLVRDEKTGNWGDPVFYTIGSASFGLQVGGDVSEIVLLVRTPKGLEEFYRSDFKLGANAGMAIGPVGEGASVHGLAADIDRLCQEERRVCRHRNRWRFRGRGG